MQAPLCEVCLNSDILCGGCAAKLADGQLTQTEIDVSRFLHRLGDKVKSLQEAKLVKVIDTDVLLLVAGKGDGAKLVGKSGAIVKALAKKYEKSIRVLEEKEFKPFLTELLQPLPVSGFNTVYTADGESYRLRVPAAQKQKQHVSDLALANISQQLFGKKVEVVFED
jgi:transcription antitermination factor NusA-like protein